MAPVDCKYRYFRCSALIVVRCIYQNLNIDLDVGTRLALSENDVENTKSDSPRTVSTNSIKMFGAMQLPPANQEG